VKSGRYQNASEVMREGLHMIEQREQQDAAKLEALRDAVNIGLADLAAGRFQDFTSINELEDHLTRATEDALNLDRAEWHAPAALEGSAYSNRRGGCASDLPLDRHPFRRRAGPSLQANDPSGEHGED